MTPLKAIESGAQTAARQAGSSTVTIQAAAIVNSKLAKVLEKNGWVKTTINIGKEKVTALQKTFEVKKTPN